MTAPGRIGQAAAAAGRMGTARVSAVPVAGGMPTPYPRLSARLPCLLRVCACATLPTIRRRIWFGAGSLARRWFGRAVGCVLMVVGHPHRAGYNTSTCPTISKMTVTLLTSQSTPTATDADALVIGVFQGPDGPVPALEIDDIDLMAALTALGAAGKSEEITKIPTGGHLATPIVVAVGLGPGAGRAEDRTERQSYLERLRRAAGAAVRELTSGRARRIAVALPADESDEAEAVALGALLGGYAFRRYRTTGTIPGDSELIVHTASASSGSPAGRATAILLPRPDVSSRIAAPAARRSRSR